jgi:hypothetical protein
LEKMPRSVSKPMQEVAMNMSTIARIGCPSAALPR